MTIDELGALGGVSAAAFKLLDSLAASDSSNSSLLIWLSLDESHSDPLVIQLESLNAPSIQVGFRMFLVFPRTLFHRLLIQLLLGVRDL